MGRFRGQTVRFAKRAARATGKTDRVDEKLFEKRFPKKPPCRPPTSPSRPPRNAYARCRSRTRVFRARLGFARTRARRCRDSHRRSSVRDSPRDVPRIIGRGFRPEVWSPPGAITRDSVARRGWKKWKIEPRGTSSSWGGRGRSWPAEKVRSAGRVTYRHVCRLCRSRPPRVRPRGGCVGAGARTRACLCVCGRVVCRGQRRVRRKRRREIAIDVAVAVARRTRRKARPQARWNRPLRRTWGEGGRRNRLPSYWTCVLCVSNSRLGRGAACVVMPARDRARRNNTPIGKGKGKGEATSTSRRSSRSSRSKRIGEPRETGLTRIGFGFNVFDVAISRRKAE